MSHSLGLFDRYRGVLASVTEADDDQHNTLDALAAVWRSSPQHVLLLADALVRRRVLRMTSVVAWVFSRENETPFASRRFDMTFIAKRAPSHAPRRRRTKTTAPNAPLPRSRSGSKSDAESCCSLMGRGSRGS